MYPYIVATYMVSVYPHWIIVHVTNLSDAAIIFRYFNPPIFKGSDEKDRIADDRNRMKKPNDRMAHQTTGLGRQIIGLETKC